jgi:hypothetical protein
MSTMPNAIFTDADGFDAVAGQAGFIMVAFERSEVESGNISSALERLLNLSDNETHVRRFEDRVTFAFAGYDDDLREVHQVPEVVAFFRKLTSHWPYWLHFIEKDASTLGVVFWLLNDMVPVAPEQVQPGMVAFRFADGSMVGETWMTLFDGLNGLYEAYGFDEDANRAMTAKSLAAFNRLMNLDA